MTFLVFSESITVGLGLCGDWLGWVGVGVFEGFGCYGFNYHGFGFCVVD